MAAIAGALAIRRRRAVRDFRIRETLNPPGGEKKIIRWYRLPSEEIRLLAEKLGEDGLTNRTQRSKALSPELQVCQSIRNDFDLVPNVTEESVMGENITMLQGSC